MGCLLLRRSRCSSINHAIGGLPFDLRPMRPNAESLAAMAEAERIARDSTVKGYRDMDELFRDLDADE